MQEYISKLAILKPVLEWLTTYIFTWEALIQAGIIIIAFIIGYIVRRRTQSRLEASINRKHWSYTANRIALNLGKLTIPIIAIIVLSLARAITQMEFIPYTLPFTQAAIKLLGAWVSIRIVAQFIDNNLIRQTFALIAWGIAALSILGILDKTKIALDKIGLNIGENHISLLSVSTSLISLFILLYGSIFIGRILERRINKISDLTPSARVLINKFMRVTLLVIVIILAMTSTGIDLSALAVVGGAIGLGIGFGLQKVVSNLFSGVMLLMDKSIKPGDIIELEQSGTFGWVSHLGARYISLVTRDGKEYLVPNEDFITQQVINWSYTTRLIRVEIRFGVHYDSDPHLVKKLAEEAATKPERIVNDPAPICHMCEFGDSSINFVLRFWINDPEKGVTNVRGDVFLRLWSIFKENNIRIPYPHREVLLKETK